jgi:putative sterol carrier protein
LNFVFQKGQSKGLNAVYHFTFTGHDEVKATVTIRDEKLQVSEGHNGQADLRLTADTETWLRFLRKEANLAWALLRRKIRISGSQVAACFRALLSIVKRHIEDTASRLARTAGSSHSARPMSQISPPRASRGGRQYSHPGA